MENELGAMVLRATSGIDDYRDDLLQQVLLLVTQGEELVSWHHSGELAMWVRWRAVDERRRRTRQQRLLRDYGHCCETKSPDTTDLALEQERAAVILNAIQQLPAEQSDAIARFYFAGESVWEIAESAGVPTSTIYSRLQRGRFRLARDPLMKGYFDESY